MNDEQPASWSTLARNDGSRPGDRDDETRAVLLIDALHGGAARLGAIGGGAHSGGVTTDPVGHTVDLPQQTR